MKDIFAAILRKYRLPQALFHSWTVTLGNFFPMVSGDTTLCNDKELKTTHMSSNTRMNIKRHAL